MCVWVKERQTDRHTYWVEQGKHGHSHTATHESQKYQILLELEFKVMRCLMWVLGSELVSSTRTLHAFDCSAISPATYFFLFIISLFLIISYMCTTKYHHVHLHFLPSNPLYTPQTMSSSQLHIFSYCPFWPFLGLFLFVWFCFFDNLLILIVLSILREYTAITGEWETKHLWGRRIFLSRYLSAAGSSSTRCGACYAVFSDVALTFGIKYAYYTCSRSVRKNRQNGEGGTYLFLWRKFHIPLYLN